ncbi:MAG: hypothetical protein LBG94_09540 [Treponema sp.]|jgi:ABC-type glycerol-3-phosphate transport system substrate-binding protein|nr:hypothetical protein [Treponema sp.]
MKRFLVLFLILAVAASVFAGGNRNTETAAAAGTAFTSYASGFPQRVTISIPVYDRAYQGLDVTNNALTRWVQSEFGNKYNVTVNYVAVGRSTEYQDYLQMLAARRAPNIVMHYDMPIAVNYYGLGALQEINWDEIAFYAPNFYNQTKGMIQQYGTLDNKKMFFFAERPVSDNFTTLVRKDWVERAGYRVDQLTNLETFNQMLLKWKELGLGTMGHRLLMNNYTYSYAFRDWPINAAERNLYSELSVADLTTNASKEWLRDMNWKYNNGVLDQEFFLRNDDAKAQAEFVAGRTGTFDMYLLSARREDVMLATQRNSPGADFAVLPVGWNVPQGKVAQSRGYWQFGMIMGISNNTTEIQRRAIWMFLEWMNTPAVLDVLQKGTNGIGLTQNNNKDYWCLVVESAREPNEDAFWAAQRALMAPQGWESLADDVIRNYRATAQWRTPDPLFTVPIPAITQYRADLNVLFQELYVRIVRAPTAQFETVYAEAVRQYNAAGYQAIIDEKRQVIQAGNFIQ